jgi:hypothetical protein
VASDRRDFGRRSEAQCRVVEWVCNHPDGSTCDEAATAAHIPATGAHRVLRRLASRYLVRSAGDARWKPDAILLSPPSLRRVEPTIKYGDDGEFDSSRGAATPEPRDIAGLDTIARLPRLTG